MEFVPIKFSKIKLKAAVDSAMNLLTHDEKRTLFFLNLDCLYKAQIDEEYQSILKSANLVLPDGIGLKLACMLIGGRVEENCNGSDFSPLFMKALADKGYKVFFLGGKDGVAECAANAMREKIPEIKIVGTHSGYFENDNEIVDKINQSGADILFVAMGVPLQEKWIARNKEKLNQRLYLGVGALFDFLSGNIKRAPKIIQKLCIEWLWRIIMEPKRLWRRYLVDDVKFLWLILRYKIK